MQEAKSILDVLVLEKLKKRKSLESVLILVMRFLKKDLIFYIQMMR
ncbi:hypothetical protein OLV37_05160 [Campylobacter jejuni]|nr:hypothetical protein [Campylobacter jejuni]